MLVTVQRRSTVQCLLCVEGVEPEFQKAQVNRPVAVLAQYFRLSQRTAKPFVTQLQGSTHHSHRALDRYDTADFRAVRRLSNHWRDHRPPDNKGSGRRLRSLLRGDLGYRDGMGNIRGKFFVAPELPRVTNDDTLVHNAGFVAVLNVHGCIRPARTAEPWRKPFIFRVVQAWGLRRDGDFQHKPVWRLMTVEKLLYVYLTLERRSPDRISLA